MNVGGNEERGGKEDGRLRSGQPPGPGLATDRYCLNILTWPVASNENPLEATGPRMHPACQRHIRRLCCRIPERSENTLENVVPCSSAMPSYASGYHFSSRIDNETTSSISISPWDTAPPPLAIICVQQTLREFCLLHGLYILLVPAFWHAKQISEKSLTCFLIVSQLIQTAFLLHPVFSDCARSPACGCFVGDLNICWLRKPPSQIPGRHRLGMPTARITIIGSVPRNQQIYKQSERLHIRPDNLTSPHCRVGRLVKPNKLGG